MTRIEARDRLLDQPGPARDAARELDRRARESGVFFTREEREKLVAFRIGATK